MKKIIIITIFLACISTVFCNNKNDIAEFNFDSLGELSLNSINKRIIIKLGNNTFFLKKGFSGGCLKYSPRNTTKVKKTRIVFPADTFNVNRFKISFMVKFRSKSIHLGRDMYFLSCNRLFFRYAIDRRAFEFGINVDGKWHSIKTPLNKLVPKKDIWYKITGIFDGNSLALFINNKKMAQQAASGSCKISSLTVGACSWNNNLKYEGDFLIDDIKISLMPAMDEELPKAQKQKSKIVANQLNNIKNGGFSKRPFVVIPYTEHPPQINGHIDASWHRAAWIGNVVYRGDDHITKILKLKTALLWDKKALYVGFICIENRTPIAMTKTRGDDGLERDDAVEVMLWIPGISLSRKPFQFKLNCEGKRDDAIRFDFKWNPEWQGKVSRSKKKWVATFRIPFKSLGVKPPAIGQQWNANFSAFLLGQKYTGFSWSPNYIYHHFDGQYGTVEFGGGKISSNSITKISVVRDNIFIKGNLNSAKGRLRALLFKSGNKKSNQRANIANVIADFDIDGRNAVTQKTVNINTANWQLTLPVSAPGKYWLMVKLFDANGKLLNVDCKPIKISNSIETVVKVYPVKKAAGIFVTLHNLKKQETADLDLKIYDNNKKLVQRRILKSLKPEVRKFIIVDNLQNEEQYSCIIKIINTATNKVQIRKLFFSIPVRPEWADTKAGLSSHVPKPWIPITYENGIFSCLNKKFAFNNMIFPVSISSAGFNLLTNDGITANVETDKNTVIVNKCSEIPSIRITSSGDKINYSAVSKNEICKVTSNTSIEFDGFTKYEITVNPYKTIKRFYVDIPLKKSIAKFVQPLETAANRDLCGKLPSGGYSLDLMTPAWGQSSVFVCNENAGLYFITNSIRNWKVPKGKMIQFIPKDGKVIMRLNLYWSNKAFSKRQRWVFYLQPTPIKPFPRDYYKVGARIMHGFQLYQPRTAVESDYVWRKTFKKETPTDNWSINLMISSRKNLKKMRAMEPIRGLYYTDKIAKLKFKNSVIHLLYDNRLGSMILKSSQKKIAKRNNVAWKANTNHFLTITCKKNRQLSFFIDGILQGSLAGHEYNIQNLILELGSVNAQYDLKSLQIQRSSTDAFKNLYSKNKIQKTSDTILLLNKKMYLKSNAKTLLDVLVQKNVKTLIYFEYWTHLQGGGVSRWEPLIKEMVGECHKRGIKLILYFGFEIADIPEQKNYIDESVRLIDKSSKYYAPARMNTYVVSYGGPYQEYILYNMKRLKDTLGIDGVYLDGTLNMNASDNPAFYCGYESNNNTRGQTIPVERIRSLARRIYNLFIENGGIVYAHLTFTPPTSGFVTAQYLGEHLGFINRNWNSVSELVDDDTAKALYAGKNSGIPTSLCCQLMWPHLAGKKIRWFEKATAWSNLYRSALPSLAPVPKSWYQNDKEWQRKCLLAAWGVDNSQWYPYWEISQNTIRSNKALRMSIWRRQDGAMLWAVQNNSSKTISGKIGLHGKFAIPSQAIVTDFIEKKSLKIEGNCVAIEKIKPYEGILIEIKKK